jgi:hypothetical protein
MLRPSDIPEGGWNKNNIVYNKHSTRAIIDYGLSLPFSNRHVINTKMPIERPSIIE